MPRPCLSESEALVIESKMVSFLKSEFALGQKVTISLIDCDGAGQATNSAVAGAPGGRGLGGPNASIGIAATRMKTLA